MKSITEIAVSLGRLCRWAGNGEGEYFSVLLHSFVVADLCPPGLELHALLHDASEAWCSDVAPWLKTDEYRNQEHRILEKIYTLHGFKMPTLEEWRLVKIADTRSVVGEAWTICPPRMHDKFPERDIEAERLIRRYIEKYPVAESIEATGTAVTEFVRRVNAVRFPAMGRVLPPLGWGQLLD